MLQFGESVGIVHVLRVNEPPEVVRINSRAGACFQLNSPATYLQPEEIMKPILFVALCALLTVGFVRSKPQPYRVAFDLTSRDSLEQKAVMRWIKEVTTSSPDAKMEVVMYAKGIELVMPERSSYLADVKEAIKNPNVKFKVCAIALKNNNVDKSQLLPGVETVPDGIHELVERQQDHWGYIKVVH